MQITHIYKYTRQQQQRHIFEVQFKWQKLASYATYIADADAVQICQNI